MTESIMPRVAAVVAAVMLGAAAPVPVAVAGFDYVDTSGEARDQQSVHATRLAGFDRTVREQVAASARYRLTDLACGPQSCTAGHMDPAALTAAARAANAHILVYGGIHKMSTLVEWVQVDVLDVDSGALRLNRTVTFRGDSDEAWDKAAHYVGRMIAE